MELHFLSNFKENITTKAVCSAGGGINFREFEIRLRVTVLKHAMSTSEAAPSEADYITTVQDSVNLPPHVKSLWMEAKREGAS